MAIYTVKAVPARFIEVVEEIDGLRKQLRHSLSDNRRRWTGLLRSSFALAIQGSNSIEGYNVTYEDAMAAVDGEEPLNAEQETWLAIKGYQNALTYVLQLARDAHYVHNEGTLRSLHFMMLAHDVARHPGVWRPGAIYVKREPTQEVVYEGPDAGQVPSLMSELVSSLNDRQAKLPIMVRGALAHLNLVMIHPFSDGNGRMGRAIQTLTLAREGIVDPRFSSIEETLAAHTQDYYNVLAQVGQGSWHPANDPLPFIKFCLSLHYRQARILLWRVKQIDRLWNALEEEGRKRRLNERMLTALADAATGLRVTNSRYRKMTEISDQVASRDLRILSEQGLLVPAGLKRGRHYSAGEWLRSLMKTLHENLSIDDPFTGKKAAPAQQYLPGLAPESDE